MRIFLLILVFCSLFNISYAYEINTAAVVQSKYYQSNMMRNRNMKQNKNYIYSEQQAKYYGYRTPTSNSPYGQYGPYSRLQTQYR